MELSTIALNYLALLKIKFDRNSFLDEVESSPYYPSIASLTSYFEKADIRYTVARFEKDEISKIKFPMLAHTIVEGEENIIIVKDQSDLYKNDSELIKIWDGIALFIHRDNSRLHEQSLIFIRKQKILGIISVISAFLLVPSVFNVFVPTIHLLAFVLLFIGVGINLAIFTKSENMYSTLASMACGTDENQSCGKLFATKFSKLTETISINDLGLAYNFTIILLIGISLLINRPDVSSLVLAISSVFGM